MRCVERALGIEISPVHGSEQGCSELGSGFALRACALHVDMTAWAAAGVFVLDELLSLLKGFQTLPAFYADRAGAGFIKLWIIVVIQRAENTHRGFGAVAHWALLLNTSFRAS